MKGFTVIAGPCSLSGTDEQMQEILEIGSIKEVDGIRVCGLKSVTSPRPFMGIDREWYITGRGTQPSYPLALRIRKETGKKIATEMMDVMQLHAYMIDPIFRDGLFVWNPAINQLGWPMYRAATIARTHGWDIGIKNPKWTGPCDADIFAGEPVSRGMKTWYGLSRFVSMAGIQPIAIARGTESADTGRYRATPNHADAAMMRQHGMRVFLDPSHMLGPKMRGEIIDRTLDALTLTTHDGDRIYSGILIEVGTSKTDTDQHISIDELQKLIAEIKKL
jgi:hypothetical protein